MVDPFRVRLCPTDQGLQPGLQILRDIVVEAMVDLKGAVKKRSQLKTTLGGATAWTKRNKKGGKLMAVKKPTKKKTAAKKFKGVRRER
jgi:hypothetical protein